MGLMLLMSCTLPSGTARISNKQLELTHPWDAKIKSLDPIQYACRSRTGGYFDLEFGGFAVHPDVFDADWPPPLNFATLLQYTASTEAAAQDIVSAVSHRRNINDVSVAYDLYGPGDYDTEVAGGQAFNDTLVNVFAWACDASRLNLTLDSTKARSPSPAIVHTTGSDQLLIDLLSDFASYHTHLYYIQSGTLYLVDMESDNGSQAIDEFEFFPNDYGDEPPVSQITDGGSNTVFTSYPYGEPYNQTPYQTAGADIAAAFGKIKDILDRPVITLRMPMPDVLPVPGKKYTFTNSTHLHKSLDIEVWARTIDYDLLSDRVTIVGDGSIAATP